jgi:hypothetical protein
MSQSRVPVDAAAWTTFVSSFSFVVFDCFTVAVWVSPEDVVACRLRLCRRVFHAARARHGRAA